jgi:hypothetical protein
MSIDKVMFSNKIELDQLLITNAHNYLNFLLINDNKKTFKYNSVIEKLLVTIFDIYVGKIIISCTEKKDLTKKIIPILKCIEHYFFTLGNSFNPNLGKNILIYRSGLQFLLDEMKIWPTEDNNTLEKFLTIFYINDGLETFDEAFFEWQNNPYSAAIDVIFYLDEDYIRPNNVPMSHVWWKNK